MTVFIVFVAVGNYNMAGLTRNSYRRYAVIGVSVAFVFLKVI